MGSTELEHQTSISQPGNRDICVFEARGEQEGIVSPFLKSHHEGPLIKQKHRMGVDEVQGQLPRLCHLVAVADPLAKIPVGRGNCTPSETTVWEPHCTPANEPRPSSKTALMTCICRRLLNNLSASRLRKACAAGTIFVPGRPQPSHVSLIGLSRPNPRWSFFVGPSW